MRALSSKPYLKASLSDSKELVETQHPVICATTEGLDKVVCQIVCVKMMQSVLFTTTTTRTSNMLVCSCDVWTLIALKSRESCGMKVLCCLGHTRILSPV